MECLFLRLTTNKSWQRRLLRVEKNTDACVVQISAEKVVENAFKEEKKIKRVILDDSVREIGAIEIPDSVTGIEPYAFDRRERLKEINIKDMALLNETGVNPRVKIITT